MQWYLGGENDWKDTSKLLSCWQASTDKDSTFFNSNILISNSSIYLAQEDI